MAGLPTHLVPTMAHTSARGTQCRRRRRSSAGRGRVQVCPPSWLVNISPCPATTALTVVEVVPAVTQDVTVAQSTLWSSPVLAGTLAAVHVVPVAAPEHDRALSVPRRRGREPGHQAGSPVTQVSDPAPCKPAGRLPPRCHWRPKSVDWADQNVVPSVAMTVHSPGLEHSTLVITVAPAGMAGRLPNSLRHRAW